MPTLTGTYTLPDGTPASGIVQIMPSEKQIIDTAGNVVLSGHVKVVLDQTGSFSVVLPATDDVTLNPTGFGYTAVAKLKHTHLPAVSFQLPAAIGTVDMTEVTQVDPSTFTPGVTYASDDDLAAVETRVATLEETRTRHKVTDAGAVGNDTTNDAAAIQALINERRDAVRTGGLVVGNEIRIPAGAYNLGSTGLTLPPYLKLICDGTVVFRYNGTGAALHITPQADDPEVIHASMDKQQWCNSPIIQGGGLVLIGTNYQGTGLEVGQRSDIGVLRPMSRYALSNIAVENFATGVQINTFHHYLGRFENLHAESNTRQVVIGAPGVLAVDSGENFSFVNCLFASGNDGIVVHADSWDATFTACSFDFLDRLATIAAGYGHLHFVGGHIEGINDSLDPSDGLFVSTVTDGEAVVNLSGVTALNKAGVPWFRGTNLAVVGDILARPLTTTHTAFPGGILAEPAVQTARLVNQKLTERRIISREHNRIPDPTLATETAGAKAGNLAGWSVEKENCTVEVVASGSPVAGGKVLRIVLNPSSYIVLRHLVALPLRHDLERHGTLAVKVSATGAHGEVRGTYQGPNGADLTTEDPVSLDIEGIPSGAWYLPAYLGRIAPNANMGARATVRPAFLLSNPTAGAITVDVAYLYFGQ